MPLSPPSAEPDARAGQLPRVTRFADLQPFEGYRDPLMPEDLADLLAPRAVLPVISAHIPDLAPCAGQNFEMYVAVCDQGKGPALHTHHRTVETYVCLEGRFLVEWSGPSTGSAILDGFDVATIPAGVERRFQAISDAPGRLMILLSGALNERPDLTYSKEVAARFETYNRDELARRNGSEAPNGNSNV